METKNVNKRDSETSKDNLRRNTTRKTDMKTAHLVSIMSFQEIPGHGIL